MRGTEFLLYIHCKNEKKLTEMLGFEAENLIIRKGRLKWFDHVEHQKANDQMIKLRQADRWEI